MKKALLYLTILVLTLTALPALAQEVTLHLTFAGDCTLGGEDYLRNSPGSFDSYIKQYGTGYPFQNVRDIFLKDDWTMVNLEGVLSDSADGLDKKRTYNFKGPTSFAAILSESGIDMVGLGNNHSGDYGQAGLQSTKDALKAAGVAYAYEDEVYILEKDGIKIAILSLTITRYDQFEDFLKEKIASLKTEEGCNFVIMAFHYGWEYSYVHNKKQRLTSHYVINCGADLVVGTHPHVVQGIEVYKNRLILYSLGNFSFGGNQTIKPRSLETYIAKVALTFEDGVFKSQQLTIVPGRISGTYPENNFQPYLVTGADAQSVIDRIQGDTPFALNPFKEGEGAVQEPVAAQ